MKDRKLKDIKSLVCAVQAENKRQIKKWGIQEQDLFKWFAFLIEETGELSEAICERHFRKGSLVSVYDEAIQVATLALKIAEMVSCGE